MISAINSSATIGYTPSTSRPAATQPAGDQVAMSLSADTFSSLVRDAGSMPEVRSDVVDTFKSRIQSGNYPDSDAIDGLVDRMGSTWIKNAQASSGS